MKAKEMMKKLMMIAALAGASALPMAAQAEATYDYMATVCVSHYADKDPTASDDNATWYSVYCLTQEAAQQAMGTTDAVDYETYAAWLGENFEANKQKTIDNAQLVDLGCFERVVKNKYYFFSYYDTYDMADLSDALGVVFFDDEKGNLAYNVLANKEGEWEFIFDEENGYPSSGWKAVTPAAPIEPMISDVTARQRYPWNGKVDIAYTATNVLAAAEAKSMSVTPQVMAIDKSVTPWTTNVAEETALFLGPRGVEPLTTEAALSNGTHRIVWDMNAQGLSNKSDRVVFVVSAEGKKPEPGLCFTALEDNSKVTIDMKNYNLEYSCDGGQTWEYDNANNGATVTLKTGDKLLVRATSAGNSAVGYDINDDCEECYPFKATGNLKLSGNVMYLLKQDGSQTEITDENVRDSMILGTRYCFQMLFYNCAGITDASELKLANNTRKYCYGNMFQKCTGLTKVPALPAMTLAEGCYWGMFSQCSSLVTVDENLLPATNMEESCYFYMFDSCTALTQAPKLPATDLPVRSCYNSMFRYCTSLTTAPLLGAIRMPRVDSPYQTAQMANMFLGCSKLSSVTLLATEIYYYSEVNSALRNWLDEAGTEATNPTLHVVKGMADNETITKNTPSNWTVVEDAK